jgi:hypothetical protein
MARRKIDRLYLVERLQWLGNPFVPDAFFARAAGAVPVTAFLDRDKAEARCRTLDDEKWAGINPFRYGSRLEDWTSLDAGRLRDWMLDLGLEPPPGPFRVARWRKWYDKVLPSLDEAQRARIREGLDRLRFFQVSEVT